MYTRARCEDQPTCRKTPGPSVDLHRYGASRRPWIVAVTASAMKGDRERFLAAGTDDYIAKPMDMDELLKVLERVPVSD